MHEPTAARAEIARASIVRTWRRSAMPLVVAIVLVACDDAVDPEEGRVPASASQGVQSLAPGPHVGYIEGFDPLGPERRADAERRFADALSAGLSISRAQLDWRELEPRAGEFDASPLDEALGRAVAVGLGPFVTLSTVDTGSLTLPADLTSEDGLTPAPGLSLDGPEIGARLEAFLDWFVPELEERGVWGLALANEPSTLFESVPRERITRFLLDGVARANALSDTIAVTVTLAGADEEDPEKIAFAADLMDHLDIASFNYYCLDGSSLLVTGPEEWARDVETFVERARGREVFFQELGCPAGWHDSGVPGDDRRSVIGASPRLQAAFYRFMLERVGTREELRAATIFQLNDWSPELADAFAEPFRTIGENVVAERLEEWLGTVGMCRWSDGECREAYTVFLESLRTIAAARGS